MRVFVVAAVRRLLCFLNELNELLFTCLCFSDADTLGMKRVFFFYVHVLVV